jgi:hypothetical protein
MRHRHTEYLIALTRVKELLVLAKKDVVEQLSLI